MIRQPCRWIWAGTVCAVLNALREAPTTAMVLASRRICWASRITPR
jgi:hypothetical protein